MHTYNGIYTEEHLNRIAFPLGGIGAGMICIEGTGALSHFSLRHRPEVYNQPAVFAAIGVKDHPELARVLEGPVPSWKLYGPPGNGPRCDRLRPTACPVSMRRPFKRAFPSR